MIVSKVILITVHCLITLQTYVFSVLTKCYKALNYISFRKINYDRLQNDAKAMSRLPIHVGIVVADEDISYTDIANIIFWCMAMGISYLSIYDREGVIKRNKSTLNAAIVKHKKGLSAPSNTNIQVHKSTIRKKEDTGSSMHIVLLSLEDGRRSLVHTSQKLAKAVTMQQYKIHDITTNNLDALLQEEQGFPDPELLLHFGQVESTLGYMPWKLRLSEILFIGPHHNLQYSSFHTALEKYGKIDKRFGK